MSFLSIADKVGAYAGHANRLDFYCRNQLFKHVELTGASLLDIGGGDGLLATWAVAEGGASRAVVLEPIMEGSTSSVHDEFAAMKEQVGSTVDVTLLPIVLEDLDPTSGPFDVVLMHNSVNHVGEPWVANLPYSLVGQEHYHAFFDLVRSRMAPGGTLIVADCSNRNFFSDVRLPNPIASSIEWHLHQPPEQWAGMLREHGFSVRRLTWTSYNGLGNVGRVLTSNKLAAYMTRSHFILELTLAD